MSGAGEIVSVLGGGGLLAAVATIIVAVIQAHSGKGNDRARAADLLARGYGGFADRLARDNEHKDKYISQLRTVAIELTDLIDELLAKEDECICEEFRSRIRKLNNRAKVLL